MSSAKQIEASRINGRRSKGPITPEGKQNSSRNNTRHGLLAQTIVLEGESEERFNTLLENYMQSHQPQSATEAALVEQLAVAQWRLMRVWGAQKLALDRDIAIQDPEARSKNRKPAAEPYFPVHPSGQTWKNEEIGCTIRTQEVDEIK